MQGLNPVSQTTRMTKGALRALTVCPQNIWQPTSNSWSLSVQILHSYGIPSYGNSSMAQRRLSYLDLILPCSQNAKTEIYKPRKDLKSPISYISPIGELLFTYSINYSHLFYCTDKGKNYLAQVKLFFTEPVPSDVCTNPLYLNTDIQFSLDVSPVRVQFCVSYIIE